MQLRTRTRVKLRGGTVVVVLMLALVAGSFAQDDPQDDQKKLDRLSITFEKPRTVTIYPGSDLENNDKGIPRSGRIYWYLPFTLKNEGPKGEKFFVSVRASSDKGRKYSDLALEFVEKKIEEVERRRLLSKVDRLKSGQKIGAYDEYAPGEARECVAIFNPLDPEADTILIDVYGLVNDIVLEKLGGGRYKVTERVLRITFERPGDEFHTALDRFKLRDKKWITVTSEMGKKG